MAGDRWRWSGVDRRAANRPIRVGRGASAGHPGTGWARRAAALAVAVVALVVPGATLAEEWGGIVPGDSTMDSVRERFGEPSSIGKKKVDKYDAVDWKYEEDRAPKGLIRMVVEFGVLKAGKYAPTAVRTFRLEPKPGVFTRGSIVIAWGKPQKMGHQDGVPVMLWDSGLTAYFEDGVVNAISLWFTQPRAQTTPATATEPKPPKP